MLYATLLTALYFRFSLPQWQPSLAYAGDAWREGRRKGRAVGSVSQVHALARTRTLGFFQHPYPPGMGFFALFHLQAPGANTTASYFRP